ncbi:MAG: VWA domain-containing protein [Gammaproteobacteria bacterium]|nr:VWA domain-containing protein [Gammaproteobacteria bacterium]
MKTAKSCTAVHALCVLLFTIIISIGVIAAENTDSNSAMDVVLIMDSSGSMKKTDPKQLIKPAAKLFISLLSPADRASIVSFSDKGYPVAFLTLLDSPQNKERLFSAVDKISTRGMFTNLYGALHGAQRVFNRNPAADRKKIIILMTDGKMDLGNKTKTDAFKTKLTKEMLPWLIKNNIEVQTIAFTEQSQTQLLKEISVATNATFNMAKTDKELHTVFSAIFEQTKSPNMLPFDGEKFTIDAAVKEVTIVGSKDGPEVRLTLLSPSSKQMNEADKPTNINWFQSSQFDIITIQNPESGQWQIKASSGKNKAYIVTDLQLKLTIEPKTPNVGEGVFIRAWLEDKGKIINKESILTTINPELHITTPEGENHTLALDIEADGQDETKASGYFFSHIAFPTAGKHSIRVTMTGSTFKRERNTLLETLDPSSNSQESHVEQHTTQHEQARHPQENIDQPPTQHEQSDENPVDSTHTQLDITPALPDIGATVAAQGSHQHESHEHETASDAEPLLSEEEKHDNDKHVEDNEKPGSTGLIIAIYLFLGINAVLLLGGGIAYLIIKKKKTTVAAVTDNKKNDETLPNETSQDKAA